MVLVPRHLLEVNAQVLPSTELACAFILFPMIMLWLFLVILFFIGLLLKEHRDLVVAENLCLLFFIFRSTWPLKEVHGGYIYFLRDPHAPICGSPSSYLCVGAWKLLLKELWEFDLVLPLSHNFKDLLHREIVRVRYELDPLAQEARTHLYFMPQKYPIILYPAYRGEHEMPLA